MTPTPTKALQELRDEMRATKHYECEDKWYSCPLSDEGCADERQTDCTCNATVAHERADCIDTILQSLASATGGQGNDEPVAWGQIGLLNGKQYLRDHYTRTPYPPPADVARNLNLVPLYTHPAARITEEQIKNLNGLDTDKRVRFYEHDFYPLSNFSAFNLAWDGLTFPTSEHAYHHVKFAIIAPEIAEQVYRAPSAHEAFKIAERNKAKRRPDWDHIKVDVMRQIIRAKAEQHEYVRRKLLATGDRELVEDSWRDDYWGWGPNRDGRNMLGTLWMELRAALTESAK